MRVLVVEDEPKLARIIHAGLCSSGLSADIASSGEDAVVMATATSYSVIVLDVMLPGMDGFATCGQLRDSGVDTPVLMLTARDAVTDRVRGLDSGADDYLTKPFAFDELLARLRALSRRVGGSRRSILTVGALRLDPASRTVHRDSTAIGLTVKEFALLEALMRRPGEALSRLDLLENAWDDAYDNRSNVIDVYIGYLRDKIDRPFGTNTIETVRGVGYRLQQPESS